MVPRRALGGSYKVDFSTRGKNVVPQASAAPSPRAKLLPVPFVPPKGAGALALSDARSVCSLASGSWPYPPVIGGKVAVIPRKPSARSLNPYFYGVNFPSAPASPDLGRGLQGSRCKRDPSSTLPALALWEPAHGAWLQARQKRTQMPQWRRLGARSMALATDTLQTSAGSPLPRQPGSGGAAKRGSPEVSSGFCPVVGPGLGPRVQDQCRCSRGWWAGWRG